jgi:predicted site-specific integrase-resolvase
MEAPQSRKETPITQDRWLRTADVATQLGIHKNTLARYVKKGEFGEVLILSQKDKRIRASALEHFIRQRLV